MSCSASSRADNGGSAAATAAAKESTGRHRVLGAVSGPTQRDGTWARPVRGSTRG